MSNAVFQWKSGAQINLDANDCGNHLEFLREHHGGALTTKIVLEDARHDNSPLHEGFEWNDSVAAEKFREDQARLIIRSLVVTVQSRPTDAPRLMRAFVSVVRDERRSFTSLEHAMSDDELRHQVLEQAWRELLQWRQKYAEYRELASLFGTIDDAHKHRISG